MRRFVGSVGMGCIVGIRIEILYKRFIISYSKLLGG
jgi:hypothetical protein